MYECLCYEVFVILALKELLMKIYFVHSVCLTLNKIINSVVFNLLKRQKHLKEYKWRNLPSVTYSVQFSYFTDLNTRILLDYPLLQYNMTQRMDQQLKKWPFLTSVHYIG